MLVIWEVKGEIKEKNKGGEDNCETNKIFYCNSGIKGVLGDKGEINGDKGASKRTLSLFTTPNDYW